MCSPLGALPISGTGASPCELLLPRARAREAVSMPKSLRQHVTLASPEKRVGDQRRWHGESQEGISHTGNAQGQNRQDCLLKQEREVKGVTTT